MFAYAYASQTVTHRDTHDERKMTYPSGDENGNEFILAIYQRNVRVVYVSNIHCYQQKLQHSILTIVIYVYT